MSKRKNSGEFLDSGAFAYKIVDRKGHYCAIGVMSAPTCQSMMRAVMKDEKVRFPLFGYDEQVFNLMHCAYNKLVRKGDKPWEWDV